MSDAITAAEANRQFSRLLREVREGQSFTVTAHGRPVARIVPTDSAGSRAVAREALLQRLAGQVAVDIGPWRRDDLYDR